MKMCKPMYVCAIVLVGAAFAGARKSRDESEKKAIRETLSGMFGLKGSEFAGGKLTDDSMLQLPPKYMLDLYEKYRTGDMKGEGSANTVRSIHAELGVVNGHSVFIFNLSSIQANEQLLSANIHIYKKKSRTNDSNIYIEVYEVADSYIAGAKVRTLQSGSFGWQSFSITSSVERCLDPNRDHKSRLIAVAFGFEGNSQHTSQSQQPQKLHLKKFVRILSRPYLIVFSNDSQKITLDHIDKHFASDEIRKPFVDPESGKKDKFLSKKIKKGSRYLYDPREYTNHRTKRDLYDNQIPESPYDTIVRKDTIYDLEVSPNVFSSSRDRTKPEKQNSNGEFDSNKESYDVFPEYEESKESTKSRLLPYPDDYKRKRKRRRRKNRKNRDKGKKKKKDEKTESRVLTLPGDWTGQGYWRNTDNIINIMNGGDPFENRQCMKHQLTVDFADIGWSDWIIYPKSFDAHYCAGTCPFPFPKDVDSYSNHAVVQGLIHAIGLNVKVPAPSCVPDTMSSVTLLYFDEQLNVVLKNYPEMTVESCTCR